MKKRNIFAILAALAVMLVVFAACGEKEPEQPENPTVIGADGQVYEEVTEIATEIVTEIVSEVVTDKQGEAVTDKEGKTEIVTEVKTEVLTTVVTVTKPYEPSTAETTTGKKQENTSASEPSSEGSSVESTTTYEDVPFPEGTIIEVEMGSDGKPKSTLTQSLIKNAKDKQALTFDATFVTGELIGIETGMPIKWYSKGNNLAVEMSLGPLNVRYIIANNKMYLAFPKAKVYMDYGELTTDKSSEDFSFDEIWNMIEPENLNYVSTSKVTVKGITYTCEEFSNDDCTKKYYFNSKKELKRIETIIPDSETVIVKVSKFSASVDDKVFSIKGFDPITEKQAETMFSGMLGSLGGLEGLM